MTPSQSMLLSQVSEAVLLAWASLLLHAFIFKCARPCVHLFRESINHGHSYSKNIFGTSRQSLHPLAATPSRSPCPSFLATMNHFLSRCPRRVLGASRAGKWQARGLVVWLLTSMSALRAL